MAKRLFGLSLIIIFLLSIAIATADDVLPIVVRPLVNGSIQPSTSFNYEFNFTTDSGCSNVILSRSAVITTDIYGMGSTEIDVLPLLTTTMPLYLCEYRDGTLRTYHNIGYTIAKGIRSVYINSDYYCNATDCFTLEELYNHQQNLSQFNNDIGYMLTSDQRYNDTILINSLIASLNDLSNFTNSVGYITNFTMNKSVMATDITFNDDVTMDTFKYSLSTGILEGGNLSINPDNVSVDISAGSSLYVDLSNINSPIVEILHWNATTINANLTLTTSRKWIGVYRSSEGVGSFVLSDIFSPLQKRTISVLGRVWGIGTADIEGVGQYSSPAFYSTATLVDLINTLGALNREGNIFSPNIAGNLKLDKSAGRSFRFSANFLNEPMSPNIQEDYSMTNISAYHYHQPNLSTTFLLSDIDPDYYDLDGVKTSVPVGNFTIQRVYYFPKSQVIDITYGHAYYPTLILATANIPLERVDLTSETLANLEGAILRAYVIVQEGTTDLTDMNKSVVISATNLGSGGGIGAVSSITDHNLMQDLQGGQGGQYYHLNAFNYNNVINQVWNLINTTVNLESLGFNTTAQLDNRYVQNNTDVQFNNIYTTYNGRITSNATCSYLFYDNNGVLRDAIC